MMNFKQKELVDRLFNAVKEKFPEVEFIKVTGGYEDPADLWVNVTAPEDEDREEEMIKFACDMTTDLLLDYGYYISIMPRKYADGLV